MWVMRCELTFEILPSAAQQHLAALYHISMGSQGSRDGGGDREWVTSFDWLQGRGQALGSMKPGAGGCSLEFRPPHAQMMARPPTPMT